MKRLLVFFLFLPIVVFTQNDYQSVLPDVEAYFEPENEIVTFDYGSEKFFRAIKLTEISTSESLNGYNNFFEFNTDNYSTFWHWDTCVYPEKYSWIGPEVLIYDDGLNVFFNRDLDSVFVQTKALLNDSWKLYKFPDESYFKANLTIHDTLSFLGIQDSVKTIEIQFFDSNNQPAYSNLNGKLIRLSKNHGIISILNFRDFPDFGEETYEVLSHDLMGLSNPELGYQKMTIGDIYDFNVGDEIHRKALADGMNSYTINTYIGKNLIHPDSMEYTFHRIHWIYTPDDYWYYNDTITTIYADINSFVIDVMPFESIYDDWELYRYMISKGGIYNGRSVLYKNTPRLYWNDEFSCFAFPFELNVTNDYKYIKGCGEFSSYTNFYSGYYEYLVYFKKGDDIWGTPLTLPLGISESSFDNFEVLVYPNPAGENVILEISQIISNNNYSLFVFNVLGEQVYSLDKLGEVNSIDVSNWNSGIYFYKISDKKGFCKQGKFFVN